MALSKGDLVTFDFTIEDPVAGRVGKRRTGSGEIADNEVNYACWPPGRTVRVLESSHYKRGELIAVTTHNLRKIPS